MRSVCGLFAAENRGDRSIVLRVPQGVGLNRRGCEVQNQWSWTVERFANMFANQSIFYKDRKATGRPPQGPFKVAVHPPPKEDSALIGM